MGDKHVAPGKVHRLDLQQPPHRPVVVPQALLPQALGDQRRIDVGHEPEGHRPRLILQGHVGEDGRIRQQARDVQPLPGQHRAGEGQALGRIVVAGDQHHRDPQLGQCRQHPAEKPDRLAGRRAPVVYVPRDHHRVGLFLLRQLQKFRHPMALIPVLQQGHAVDGFAEVQIRQMEKSHTSHLSARSFS